jgi:hypothetical protein
MYQKCPKEYEYAYSKGLRKYVDEPKPGSPLKIGLDVHELFEWYYLQPEAKKITLPYKERICNILRQNPILDVDEYEPYVTNFAEFNADIARRVGVPKYVPEDVELELYDKDLNIVGIIDAVYRDNGDRILVDYKTSKKPRSLKEYRLELIIYKILYEKVTGKKVDYCGIYFPYVNKFRTMKALGPGEEPPEKEPYFTLEDEFLVLSLIDKTRTDIYNKIFPRKPSFLCREYCDFYKECSSEKNI